MAADQEKSLSDLQLAQLEQVRLQNERLKVELRESRHRIPWIHSFIPVITALVAVCGLLWGVFQYRDQQSQNRTAQKAQADRQSEANEREFMKPWLDSQRQIYFEALSAVAEIANFDSDEARSEAIQTFWRLYHGKMIMVETRAVSSAMQAVGGCLGPTNPCDKDELNKRSRALATEMAQSMAATARMTYKEFEANQFKYR